MKKMLRLQFVLAGLLLLAFSQVAVAQVPIRNYSQDRQQAVPRPASQPVKDQVTPIVKDVARGVARSWWYGVGYPYSYGFYNPWFDGYYRFLDLNMSQAGSAGFQQSRGYQPAMPLGPESCKIKGDTHLTNGEDEDPMKIEILGPKGQPVSLDDSWAREIMKKRKIKTSENAVWIYGGDTVCLPFPIGFKYKVTGFTGYGDGDDPSVVFGEAGSTEGPLKANRVSGGWVFTLPPVLNPR
jgi:hypothetical protein